MKGKRVEKKFKILDKKEFLLFVSLKKIFLYVWNENDITVVLIKFLVIRFYVDEMVHLNDSHLKYLTTQEIFFYWKQSLFCLLLH